MGKSRPTTLSNNEIIASSYLDTGDIASSVANPFRRHRAAALKDLKRALAKHLPYLCVKHNECIAHGPYDTTHFNEKKWDRERRLFVRSALTDREMPVRALEFFQDEFFRVIDDAVTAAENKSGHSDATPGTMSPREFELHCATTLRKVGWTANAMAGVADQGMDVLAEKGRLRVVVQCKLWSRPVGNKAVQEVHAGKSVAKATHAAVVTNASFTPSARQAAAATGTLLLTVEELPSLEQLIRCNRSS